MAGLTVAVVGTGYMGKQYLEVFAKLAERLVICSTDPVRGAALAERYGARCYGSCSGMLAAETPDVVAVCLPTHLHAAVVREALEHGCAVLCEKPFAASAAEARELCALAKERGALLMVAHLLRFSRHYTYLKRCIEDGRFGALLQLQMYRHSAAPVWSAGNWLQDPARSGGVIKDMHIHETDLIYWMLGMPQEVLAVGDSRVCATTYRYPTCSVVASSSWRNAPDYPFTAGFDAVFERGVLCCSDRSVTLYAADGSCADPLPEEPFEAQLYGADHLENEIRYFLSCLRQGSAPALCMPEDSLAALLLNEAEQRSLRSGRAERPEAL